MQLQVRYRQALGGFMAATALVFLVIGQVAAQATSNGSAVERITMSPSSKSFTIDAGTSQEGTFEVINSGDTDFDFKIYAQPYGVKTESYTPDFSGKFPNSDAYKWVRLDTTSGSLKAGQKKDVSYALDVPATAAPGGHYGVIFAETKAKDIGGTGVARQKRVGQILFATVNGSIQRHGEVAGFNLPFWQGTPPLISSVRIKNTGNVNIDTKVETIAKDIFGRTKFTYTGDAAVLRETTRRVDMNWDKAPTFGLFRVTQGVKFLGQENIHQGFVLIAPRWFLIVIILIILAGVGYAVVQRRKRRG
jgi:hypothetical protein